MKEYGIVFVWPSPSPANVVPKVTNLRITNECCGDTFNLTGTHYRTSHPSIITASLICALGCVICGIVHELTSRGFILRITRTDKNDGWGQDLIAAWITIPIIGYKLDRIHEVGSMYIHGAYTAISMNASLIVMHG